MQERRRCPHLPTFPFVAFALLLLLAACGCGPAVVGPAPAGWPAEVNGRRLYNTPSAYVYATSDLAAGEADQAVRSAAAEIVRAGGEPGKGVVIVTDLGDGPLGNDARHFCRAIRSDD